MTFFADLTPHSYTPTDGLLVLNIGWLDKGCPFVRAATSPQFHEALRLLCQRPIHLHRGFHICQFCPREDPAIWPPSDPRRLGNGQIRVLGRDGDTWYAAPTMIYHYVVAHEYQPPEVFIEAVLARQTVADNT
jgi:hypothetical protein